MISLTKRGGIIMTQQDMRLLIEKYRRGWMTAEEIERYEKANGRSIEEIVSKLEELFEKKDYTICTMTITALKRLVKYPEQITEVDKEKYERYNNCSIENVIAQAKLRTDVFDGDRENRQMRGQVQRIKRMMTESKRAQIDYEAMEAQGVGEYDKEGGVFASSDFLAMMNYRSSVKPIWNRIVAEISERERDIHTMPELGRGEEYFHVSVDAENKLEIRQSLRKPCKMIKTPTFLFEKDCESMYELYIGVRNGNKVEGEIGEEVEYWLGILKYFRMPYRR